MSLSDHDLLIILKHIDNYETFNTFIKTFNLTNKNLIHSTFNSINIHNYYILSKQEIKNILDNFKRISPELEEIILNIVIKGNALHKYELNYIIQNYINFKSLTNLNVKINFGKPMATYINDISAPELYVLNNIEFIIPLYIRDCIYDHNVEDEMKRIDNIFDKSLKYPHLKFICNLHHHFDYNIIPDKYKNNKNVYFSYDSMKYKFNNDETFNEFEIQQNLFHHRHHTLFHEIENMSLINEIKDMKNKYKNDMITFENNDDRFSLKLSELTLGQIYLNTSIQYWPNGKVKHFDNIYNKQVKINNYVRIFKNEDNNKRYISWKFHDKYYYNMIKRCSMIRYMIESYFENLKYY